jgi:hypothetical protein
MTSAGTIPRDAAQSRHPATAESRSEAYWRGQRRKEAVRRGLDPFAFDDLHALAYNLGNFLRTLATPEPIKEWSLTSLKEKLIKIGAKIVSHGRYVAFQMAENMIIHQSSEARMNSTCLLYFAQ